MLLFVPLFLAGHVVFLEETGRVLFFEEAGRTVFLERAGCMVYLERAGWVPGDLHVLSLTISSDCSIDVLHS